MKRLILSFILATICGISVFAIDFDFSAVCSSGQTLYYKITSSTEPYTVQVTYPNYREGYSSYYYHYTPPTGNLVIPTSVTNSGITYSVTGIREHAFYFCSGLTEVTIPESVTSIGERAFNSCSGLTTLNYNATNCTYMGNQNNPVFVTFINGNSVTLNIGENVTRIPEYAFYNWMNLTAVYYAGTIEQWCGITFGNESSNPLRYAQNLYIDNSLVTDLVIPNTITEIKDYAFSGASCLTSVTIPNSVTSIGSSAFYGCSGLISITIPNSITSIESYTFENCIGLTSVTIGNSVTSIGNYAFKGCSGLTSVTIPNSVTSIGERAFQGCSGLTSVTIPNSVNRIGSAVFAGCRGLVEMTIPWVGAGVTGINSTALFGYVFGTTSYTGGTAVTQYYYSSSNNMTTYYIPSSLRSVTVTNGVLKYGAFYGCSMLTSVTIGDGVTSIGQMAFYNCSGLTDIYVNRTTPPTVEGSFNRYTATVWVPCGSLEAYQQASVWSNFSDIRESLPYTLNVSSADLTMGTASVTQQPTCTDATAVITATPNEGCVFVQWNDGNTDNPRTITVTGNVEYTAYFGHNIIVVSADETMGTVSGGGTYLNGEQVEISAVANEHYHFVQWNDGNTDNPRTITVTENATYTATFAIDQFSITVESDNVNFGNVSGSGTYGYGSEIQISATPAEHHHFTQWNDGNTDNPRTITVTENATYTASFAIDQHTVTVVSADTEMGTVSESGTYDYGTEIQISATPAEGYGFATWNDGNINNPRTIVVTEDITYTATFGAWRTITVLSADETLGTVSGSGVYVEGAQVEISAEAVEHYHFTQWNDGNTDNPRTITIAGDSTFTASFAIDRFTITVESADEAMGTVSESNTYDYGTEIQISATASEHYHFVSWNDGNIENPRTLTVTEDATYRASFAADMFTITVESADDAMGTVSEGGTYDYGTEIQISATPNNGYRFVQWNDGNTDNPRTVVVTNDTTFIASFEVGNGIEENSIESQISLYPNPVGNTLNITSSETISEIEIVNVMGQVVRRIEVNSDNAVCDVNELTSGVYVVRIHTEGTVVSQRKFVKK